MLAKNCYKCVKNIQRGVIKVDSSLFDKINYLFYCKHYSVTEISKELSIDRSIVSRTIKKDPRYHEEKEKRREENKKKHNEKTKEYILEKREAEKKLRNEITDYFFRHLSPLDFLYDHTEEKIAHNYNIPLFLVYEILSKNERYKEIEKIREMSSEMQMAKLHQLELNTTVKRRRISEQLIFESCKSAYEYDKENERFVFTEKFGKKPRDLKKYYKVHIQMTITDELKNKIEEEKRISQVEKEVIEKEK